MPATGDTLGNHAKPQEISYREFSNTNSQLGPQRLSEQFFTIFGAESMVKSAHLPDINVIQRNINTFDF